MVTTTLFLIAACSLLETYGTLSAKLLHTLYLYGLILMHVKCERIRGVRTYWLKRLNMTNAISLNSQYEGYLDF